MFDLHCHYDLFLHCFDVRRTRYIGQEAELQTKFGVGCLSQTELEDINNQNQRENTPQNCAKLNGKAHPYFDAGVVNIKTGVGKRMLVVGLVVLLGVVGWLGGGWVVVVDWLVVTGGSLFLFGFNIMNFNIMNHFQPLMSCVHINLLSIFVSILSLAYGGIYHQHSIHTPSILHPYSIHTQSSSSIYLLNLPSHSIYPHQVPAPLKASRTPSFPAATTISATGTKP